jgi:hypothetical protein
MGPAPELGVAMRLNMIRLPRLSWPHVVAWTVLTVYIVARASQQAHGDAWAYYTADLSDLYAGSHLETVSYVYTPPLAQVIQPLHMLPFAGFLALMTALELGALVYLVGPIWAALLVVVGPTNLADELANANVNLLIGVAIVMAFRRPAWWALPVVTKLTPGIALTWHLARREWRALAIAIGVSAIIFAVSFLISPGAWLDWWQFVRSNAGGTQNWITSPLWVRAPIASGLAWWAGRHDLHWPVPIAAVVALPLPMMDHWTIALASIPLALADYRPGCPRP